jgi:hypothetical protein
MNNIILGTSLFGSSYLFAKSIQIINDSHLQNKDVVHELYIINILTIILTVMLSGTVVIANYYALYNLIKP